tara:strand:- start:545 stop:889 length:345 start_codon:yes stop_codon:yes gene_type:complete
MLENNGALVTEAYIWTGELKMLSDFQKSFLARGTGNKLFTEQELFTELEAVRREIMTMSIEAAKMAVKIERDACALVVDKMIEGLEGVDIPLSVGVALEQAAEKIRNRIPSQNQ